MKTFTCGEHKFDELPNGDVQVTVTDRGICHIESKGKKQEIPAKPHDVVSIIIPKADRQRLGDFIAGQQQLL